MTFRNVGNRVAADLASFNLSISNEEALNILGERKIRPIEVDIADQAKCLVGVAKWRWGSKQWEAPHYFDCSALTKWLYGQIGIWLPRRTTQQYELCKKQGGIVELSDMTSGDLVFSSSPFKNGVRTNSDDGIGHVSIAVGSDRIISATNSELGCGVVCLTIDEISATRKIRAIGRVCQLENITTFLFPPGIEVESSDDVKYILAHS